LHERAEPVPREGRMIGGSGRDELI